MIIAIVGLGLIGGSLAKSIKLNTNHTVYGIDTSVTTIEKALFENSIDKCISVNQLEIADLTFVCLYPEATVDFILANIKNFKSQSIVSDICGIKDYVSGNVAISLWQNDINYVGTHPMAGKEFSGYEYSSVDLFNGASMIITRVEHTNQESVATVKQLALQLKFAKVVEVNPVQHDIVIAFTSQLAHIVSSAYIKSPTATEEYGFSAGSFKDLTRVAKLNPEMWTSLFLKNKEPLIYEIDNIIKHLLEYRDTIEQGDKTQLYNLLEDGSLKKEKSMALHCKE